MPAPQCKQRILLKRRNRFHLETLNAALTCYQRGRRSSQLICVEVFKRWTTKITVSTSDTPRNAFQASDSGETAAGVALSEKTFLLLLCFATCALH